MLTDGILNLLKPSDMSSQQAVQAIKRLVPCKKAGHSGTLDPSAAGVLPVFLDSATRLTGYAMAGDKEYIAQLQFGIETDTQDAQGQVVNASDRVVTRFEMEELLRAIPYEHWQTPPAYSAIKMDGKKMVDLARKGITKEIPQRQVYIYEKELLREVAPNAFLIRIRCSKGTYIRTLCHDLGRQAGAFAHCSFLLRTRSGPFTLEQAVTFEQIQQAMQNNTLGSLLMPIGMAVSHLEKVELDPANAQRISNGQMLSDIDIDMHKDDPICTLWYQNKLVGIGERNSNTIKPVKVFHGSE